MKCEQLKLHVKNYSAIFALSKINSKYSNENN